MTNMKLDQKLAKSTLRNTKNNMQGHVFEGYISAACAVYRSRGVADIAKTPEPFRVMSKGKNGMFTGRFTAHARPDFEGTLKGGRSIVFEAKFTSTDRLRQNALTDTQLQTLVHRDKLGAKTGICCGIKDKFYFVPTGIWADMKGVFGKMYVTQADLERWRVRFTGAVMFLDYVGGKKW